MQCRARLTGGARCWRWCTQIQVRKQVVQVLGGRIEFAVERPICWYGLSRFTNDRDAYTITAMRRSTALQTETPSP